MDQELTVGARLKSAACTTEVVVIRAPAGAPDLRCGGAAMAAEAVAGSEPLDSSASGGSLLGKRYTDADTGIELLVVKAGEGSLAIDGRALSVKGAKPLPASD